MIENNQFSKTVSHFAGCVEFLSLQPQMPQRKGIFDVPKEFLTEYIQVHKEFEKARQKVDKLQQQIDQATLYVAPFEFPEFPQPGRQLYPPEEARRQDYLNRLAQVKSEYENGPHDEKTLRAAVKQAKQLWEQFCQP